MRRQAVDLHLAVADRNRPQPGVDDVGGGRLAAARRALRIERVYWYTWLSEEGSPNSFDYSGLRRIRGSRTISVPALASFRAAARRLEGCAKADGDASRCR